MLTTDLLDRHAAAARRGVSVKSLDKTRERSDKGIGPKFPDPALTIGNTPLWRSEDIDAFNRDHPKRRRRTNVVVDSAA